MNGAAQNAQKRLREDIAQLEFELACLADSTEVSETHRAELITQLEELKARIEQLGHDQTSAATGGAHPEATK